MQFQSSINYHPMSVISNSSNNAFNSVEIYYVLGSHFFVKCYITINKCFVDFDGFNESQKFVLGVLRLLDNKNTEELTIKGALVELDSLSFKAPILINILIILRFYVRWQMISDTKYTPRQMMHLFHVPGAQRDHIHA